MKRKTILKSIFTLIIAISITQCGASLSGVRGDLGIPNPNIKALSSATVDANQHPHNVSTLIEYGEQLYGAEQFYKAYYQWDYVLKLDPENSDAKEKIKKGITVLYYKMIPGIKTEADFNSKWNDQSWKNNAKRDIDSSVYAKMVEETHLPIDAIRSRSTEVVFNLKKMSVKELGIKYNGYVLYIAKRMPFLSQRELFRALKIEENMNAGKYYLAAKAINEIPTYFPHAKFDAEKLEHTIKNKWYKHLISQSSMDFKYYDEHKEALYSFIRFYQGSKESKKLGNRIEEMLYNYFTSTPITDLNSAVKYWNNVQKFSTEFRKSKYRPLVQKSVEDKWSQYLKNSATVIISNPQRTKNEIFAFRNAFGITNPQLVKDVGNELDMYMLRRFSSFSISDTSDINKAYSILKSYNATFPSSNGYFSLEKTFQQKISSYILNLQVSDGESLKNAKDTYNDYRANFPTSGYLPTIKEFINNKTEELHAEATKYYDLAKSSKEKNQYTLAARYIQKTLELEPDNIDAKSLSVDMSDYMDAISSFNSIITKASDATTYSEAMNILNTFIKKYGEYKELITDIKNEKKTLKKYKKRWSKRPTNSFK